MLFNILDTNLRVHVRTRVRMCGKWYLGLGLLLGSLGRRLSLGPDLGQLGQLRLGLNFHRTTKEGYVSRQGCCFRSKIKYSI